MKRSISSRVPIYSSSLLWSIMHSNIVMQQEHRSQNLSLIGFGMDDVEVAADSGTTNPLLWGLILDFSHRHHDDSRRSIDIAKEELIRVVTSLQTDDKVYVSEPGRLDIAPRAGVAVGQIAQYEM